MAGITPGVLVDAPEPIGTRYGLFAAAIGPLDLPPHGSGGGVKYVPACGGAYTLPVLCADGVVSDNPKDAPQQLPDPIFEADPFTVYATYPCGSVGYSQEELKNKALRRLLNGEQGAVELAFWSGEASGISAEITSLQDNVVDILVSGNENIEAVVGQLERAAYFSQRYGNIAYIHAPVSVAAWAASANLVIKDGPRLRTPYGSIWVFGGGYPGTGAAEADPPDGGAYMHITGQVTVWRSPEPYVFADAQTLDRETNEYFILAEREYAVGYDCFNIRAVFNPLGEA